MIKLTFCLRRRPDLSAEEFHRYWRDEHGPSVEFARISSAAAHRVRRTSAKSFVSTCPSPFSMWSDPINVWR